MKNLIKQLFIGSFLLLTVASCSKNNDDDPTPPTEKQTDVYMAGYVEVPGVGGSYRRATLWKNGVGQQLGSSESWVDKVLVAGDDVYAAGREYEGSKSVAKLWKNGIATNLINSSNNTEAISCAVAASGDVYTVIREWSNILNEYKVLKNGMPVSQNLSNGNNIGFPMDVFVSGNDVYIAGIEVVTATNSAKAVYWKNGNLTNLPTISGNDPKAVKIFVSGNDVYVLGQEDRLSKRVILLWKNGTPTNITDGTKDASLDALFVSGNDVYITGKEDNETTFSSVNTLWKNGISVFTSSEKYISLTSVSVLSNNVYLAGSGYYNGSVAYLWKNGILETPKIEKASFNSVFVVEK